MTLFNNLFLNLECESVKTHCDGLSKHAHFHNFGMAFLTLFRIATGDNWNGIMKDTLKENVLCQDDINPGSTNVHTMCLASMLAPIYFVIFVLMAQFVLVNVVVAVLMKHLDVSCFFFEKSYFYLMKFHQNASLYLKLIYNSKKLCHKKNLQFYSVSTLFKII